MTLSKIFGTLVSCASLLIAVGAPALANATSLNSEQEASLKKSAIQVKEAVLDRNVDQLMSFINPEGVLSASGDEEISYAIVEKDLKQTKGTIYCGIWGGYPRKNHSIFEGFKRYEKLGLAPRITVEPNQSGADIIAVVTYTPSKPSRKKFTGMPHAEWIWRATKGWKMLTIFD